MASLPSKFHHFSSSIEGIELPLEFTFPFYYVPHPLSVLASNQLQEYLHNQNDFTHDFGHTDPTEKSIGKMFGVLVVQTEEGEIGFLAAYSGKLAESNHLEYFVPPVFDILPAEGFYKKGEHFVNECNRKLAELESSSVWNELNHELNELFDQRNEEITNLKASIKSNKSNRDLLRNEAKENLSLLELKDLNQQLNYESQTEQIQLKRTTKSWNEKIAEVEQKMKAFKEEIEYLRNERKVLSSQLQKKIFSSYNFLNSFGKNKSLYSIFENTVWKTPPAGAGECAAPKLLQYAYLHGLKPIALAEFWWGNPPASEIRKHGHFYPSCRGKCEPILGHMLKGLQVEENPMEHVPKTSDEIPILYEDDHLLIINKPHELLSVPGKQVKDSVYKRMRNYMPEATGPLVVHRLDMSTSGIMIISKSLEIYKKLQFQFISRRIKKSYIALLDGEIKDTSGVIDLPLRVDLEDRPRQLVCFEHGKPAVTEYEVISIMDGKTRMRFYPITGRTHQLRVHSSHPDGLNSPIVGDDLYGERNERLHLHAEQITFKHPITKEVLTFQIDPEF